jgi:hypothetical protein
MILTSLFRDILGSRRQQGPPLLSVVVNFFNNCREARNTLFSLSRNYQLEALEIPYEVIVLDHGSTEALSEAEVRAFGPEFDYRFVRTKAVSPVKAINQACFEAIGEQLMVIIDGAHILTPGVFRLVRQAFSRFASPFIATVPFHLGPARQNLSINDGYDQQVEDSLLQTCGWRSNGYRLFSVSAAFADDSGGWHGQLFESGCFAMRRVDFVALGGFDERFQSRGGGLANLDLFQRALISQSLHYVVLIGEGTFHQVHGGVATNAPIQQHPWKAFHEEYVRVRGVPFFRVPRQPYLLGEILEEASHVDQFSRTVAREIWRTNPPVVELSSAQK